MSYYSRMLRFIQKPCSSWLELARKSQIPVNVLRWIWDGVVVDGEARNLIKDLLNLENSVKVMETSVKDKGCSSLFL